MRQFCCSFNRFGCFLLDMLIAKLFAYDLDMASLKLIYNYLGGRKQRVKTNDKYGESLFVMPQGFIMELLLFSVFYATIFYVLMIQIVPVMLTITVQHNLKQLLLFKNVKSSVLTGFMVQNIKMKANADKCRFLVSAKVS